MIVQFCGLSGSGKTTLAQSVKLLLDKQGIPVEVIDGDEYRKALCSDLGFSKEDRNQNIRRLAFVANKLSQHGIVTIICAINPYEDIRQEVVNTYPGVKTVYIHCSMGTLIERDTKGLYKRAMLPKKDPRHLANLTGVNDPFDAPTNPDLIIDTDEESIESATKKIADLIRL